MKIKKSSIRIALALGVFVLVALAVFLAAPAPQASACACCSPPGIPNCTVVIEVGVTIARCRVGECTQTWHCECADPHWVLVSEVCPPPGPSPFVDLLSCDPGETPALTVANAEGQLPCGAGIVDDWGHNVFDLTRLECCAEIGEDATVYCLDAEGNWTDEFVGDVTVSLENGTVAFQSKQHGMCAIFP